MELGCINVYKMFIRKPLRNHFLVKKYTPLISIWNLKETKNLA